MAKLRVIRSRFYLLYRFTNGIGDAEWARLDSKWYRSGYYSIHRVDAEGAQFRFDYHPKPKGPERHFHPPTKAPRYPVEKSSITDWEPDVVARAVLLLWRRAYDENDLPILDDATDPP